MDELSDSLLISQAGAILQNLCHGASKVAGWWIDPKTGKRHDVHAKVPEKLMLIVSELGEAMEAHRKTLKDDKLPHREGLEVELADAVIRIFDLAGACGFHLGEAIAEKMEFNAHRPDHKLEARMAPGGKAY